MVLQRFRPHAFAIASRGVTTRVRIRPRPPSTRFPPLPLPKVEAIFAMMRIKEAIQRRKIIQQMNDDWIEEQDTNDEVVVEEESESDPFLLFVHDLTAKMNDSQVSNVLLESAQKRALRVTWKRLSEAPKTSGRGTIHIMEKVFEKLAHSEPAMRSIFYKSAFLSCIEDRVCQRAFPQQWSRCPGGRTIATLRDHAHLLVDFVDALLCTMFELPVQKTVLDPRSIGLAHARLQPLGFERRFWNKLGECFAEVFFMQDCVRAYPHAPSAWSLLSVTVTDAMFAASKPLKASSTQLLPSSLSAVRDPPSSEEDERRPASPSYSREGSPAPSFPPSPVSAPLYTSWRDVGDAGFISVHRSLERTHSDVPRRLLQLPESRSTIV